jgi:HK97 family phage major capsid protein/HK97 family phage prohead protease
MDMQRAYSLLSVKAVDDDKRVITGIASSPTTDRQGDVVEPLGAKFKTPMPLLLYHDSERPVGRVVFAKPTKDGIPFTATLPNVAEPGVVQDRVNEAYHSLKYLLIGAVSIGFRVLEDGYELMKNGGYRIKEWEWLELSLCSIPANPDALIQSFKSMDPARIRASIGANISSMDSQARAALGSASPGREPPGASGTKQTAASGGFFHSRSPKGKETMKTMNELLSELRETRTQKAARMTELVELIKAGEDHGAEFDALESEVSDLDNAIRVKRVEAMNASAARPVDGTTSKAATESRGPTIIVRKTDADDKFAGQSFVRMVRAKWLAKANDCSASEVAEQLWGKTNPNMVRWIKAAVAGGGTGSGEWGAELADSDTKYMGDFITYLHGMTVFDRLPLRQVPARVHIKGQDGAATGYWVGESKSIPPSAQDFSDVELTPLKVAALAVVSNELLRDSSPAAEMLVRDALVEASAQRVDTTFFSATAASAGVSPAGLLNGVTGVQASGTDAAAIRADIQSLYAPFFSAKNASGIQLVMTPSMAKAISLLVNSLGQTEFPGLNSTGGSLLGDTVWTGDNVTAGNIVALKPSDIYRIGDSGVQVSMSREATIEMNDAAAGASDTPVAMASHTVSMYQTESTAIKVVRSINYAKRRSHAVQFIENAEYGGVVS